MSAEDQDSIADIAPSPTGDWRHLDDDVSEKADTISLGSEDSVEEYEALLYGFPSSATGVAKGIHGASTVTESTAVSGSGTSDEGKDVQHSRKTLLCNDVIIDNILAELDVQDIAKLRQVSQQLWECSKEGAVWKRKLEREKHFLPPVPPTARYSLENLSPTEAERFLVRCASLARGWDAERPRYLHNWKFDAYRIVVDMVLLPGGQYIVASVTDQFWSRFSVRVFTSDFKYSMASPIAQMDVPTKAFELRAKYMTFRGKPGIVIAYIRRDYRHSAYKTRFDVNRLADGYQPPANDRQLKYECVVTHVELAAVELLGDVTGTAPQSRQEFQILAEQQGRPFQVLTEITSRSRLSSPAIDDDVDGAPLIAVLKHADGVADRIIYKNLDGGPGTTLIGTPHANLPHLPQSIMAFGIIPIQKQFLVIRRAGVDVDMDSEPEGAAPAANAQDPFAPYYWAELWDIVDGAGQAPITRDPASFSNIFTSQGNYWKKVWISDHGLGPALAHDLSLRPQLLGRGGRPKLKPITVFVKARRCAGIAYSALWPRGHPLGRLTSEDLASGPETYRYDFGPSFLLFDPADLVDDEAHLRYVEYQALPGSARPLLYTVPIDTARQNRFQIAAIMGLWDRALLKPFDVSAAVRILQAADEGTTEVKDGALMVDGDRVTRVSEEFEMEHKSLRTISAIAWDDTIGRLCIAYANRTELAVFDFAAVPLRASSCSGGVDR
ncbi:hypothetical protein PYCCODRAFT_1369886 [Trametes coccinea BRFM310]|uniref:F-box domain-containing protein n=1 Tax=Trametes coccinea (strain BRFM310) TaxID=1353009 RepID=A0A1Y2IKH5_TRAC3|nr:hypothetical protein PYCCODRAFT_1369886 [Trametes coccinea BRFM310]